jgi:pimeloyl-ACP methyl ester carboxylesterase
VFGHSSGAAIALRAAAAGLPVAGIVAYEAPFGNDDTPAPEVDPDERIRELVAVATAPRGSAARSPSRPPRRPARS